MPKLFGRRISATNLSLAIVLVVIVIGGAWFIWLKPDGSGSSSGATASSATTTAAVTDVSATVSASGTAQPAVMQTVSLSDLGANPTVQVSVGATVTAGQTLASGSSSTSADSASQIAQAKKNLLQAQVKYNETVDQYANSEYRATYVQLAQYDVDAAQDQLNSLYSNGSGSTVTSPIGGTVLSASDSSVIVGDLSSWVVSGSLSETDVANVSVGQAVSVTFNAFTGQTFTGTVQTVDLVATSSSGVTGYGFTVAITDPPSGLRDGATATIIITTASASQVLAVPSSAVTTATDGTHTVELVSGGKTTTTTVEIGVKGDLYTEITSGLSEGDVVKLGATASSSGSSLRERFEEGGFGGGTFTGGTASFGGGTGAGVAPNGGSVSK